MEVKNLAEVKEEAAGTNRVKEFLRTVEALGNELGIKNCLVICEGQHLGIGTVAGILGATPEGGPPNEEVNLEEITLQDVLDKIDFSNPGKWSLDALKDNISIQVKRFLPVMQIMCGGYPIAFICKRQDRLVAYAANARGGIVDRFLSMSLNATMKDFPLEDLFNARNAHQVRRVLEYIYTAKDWRNK